MKRSWITWRKTSSWMQPFQIADELACWAETELGLIRPHAFCASMGKVTTFESGTIAYKRQGEVAPKR